jgi:hypothetical protein
VRMQDFLNSSLPLPPPLGHWRLWKHHPLPVCPSRDVVRWSCSLGLYPDANGGSLPHAASHDGRQQQYWWRPHHDPGSDGHSSSPALPLLDSCLFAASSTRHSRCSAPPPPASGSFCNVCLRPARRPYGNGRRGSERDGVWRRWSARGAIWHVHHSNHGWRRRTIWTG